MILRNLNQFSTMLSHQFLVGSTHTFSCFQAASGKLIRRMKSSHNLSHDLHFIIIKDVFKIMCQYIHDRISRKFS